MKRVSKLLLIGLLGLLIIPVLVTLVVEPTTRSLTGVRLDETEHEEIRFRNADRDLQLAGLLFVPKGTGPLPAAVVIHGSGTSTRDNAWYLTLVQYLQQSGVLVLLPDKRGSEQSEGQWRTASYEDLASDTVAAVEYLRSREDLDVGSVGVIGLSQGGRIAPIVATELRDLSFVVNVVGGAVPAHAELVYEETHNLRELGILPGVAHVLAYPAAWSLIYVRQKDHWSAVGNFDPLRYWRDVAVPSLILYGEDDTNTASSESAARLRALGRPNVRVQIYPGSGHPLEDPPERGNSIFRKDALEDIRAFILDGSAAVTDRPHD